MQLETNGCDLAPSTEAAPRRMGCEVLGEGSRKFPPEINPPARGCPPPFAPSPYLCYNPPQEAPQKKARERYADEGFRQKMRSLFEGEPAGRLVIPTLEDALERIAELEGRVAALEQRPK